MSSVSSRSSTSSTAVPPYAVRSKYAFTAAEDVEISAGEKEVLACTAAGLDEEWVLVSRPTGSAEDGTLDLEKGYVPGGYLERLPEGDPEGNRAIAAYSEASAARKARKRLSRSGRSVAKVATTTSANDISAGSDAAATDSGNNNGDNGSGDGKRVASGGGGDVVSGSQAGVGSPVGAGRGAATLSTPASKSVITVVSSGGGASKDGVNSTQQQQQQQQRPQPTTTTTVTTTTVSSASSGEAVASLQALADLCAKHEERVREVAVRREETFKRLQASMGSALEQIESCRRKNESLARRLEDMDALIDEERTRWMSQVDAVAKGLELGSGQ